MKLSDGEKLILIMLSEIHQRLNITNEIDPDFVKSAIRNNQLWGIKWKNCGIYDSSDDTPQIVIEICNILDMWSFLESSYLSYARKFSRLRR